MSLLGSFTNGIGSLFGGIGSLFGGGQQQQNVTTQQSPWGPQQPYLQDVFGGAQRLYQQGGPQVYPNSTVSPFTGMQQQGLQQQANLAQNPQTTQAATGYYNKVLNGDYLFGGQGFNAALGAANAQISPLIAGQFEGHGRYGSGAQGNELGTQLGNVFAGMYGQERQNQQQAFGLAPQLQGMQYNDPNQLFNAGQAQQGQSQAELSDVVNRYTQEQQRPYSNLSNYASNIYGAPSYPSQTQPYFRNQTAGMLGGALGGGALGFQMGGPWGGAIGAGLGLLAGRQ